MMKRLIWLVLLTAIGSYASVLQLGKEGSYTAEGHISFLEDPEGTLEFSQVQKSRFSPYHGASVNFGFTKSAYWFKIDIKREIQSGHRKWWLMISYPLLEKIDVFFTDQEGELLSYQTMGSSLPLATRELQLNNFLTELPLYQEGEATLYIRVKTQSSMQVPISFYSPEALYAETEKSNLTVGVYYGIFLIILLYNIIIFFYTKDRNYLRYIFFLTSYIFWQLSFDGIGAQYLWQDFFWLIEHGSSFWIAMSAFTALYFSRSFLHTAQYTKSMDGVIRLIMGFALSMAAASLLLPYEKVIVINTTLAAIVPLTLFSTGILVMKRGYRPARFYVAGWSSLLIGTLIFAFNKFNLIPSFYGVNHIQQVGSAIEMILLSWALADRVHLLQKEYIGKLSHLNETLTEKVNSALSEARHKDQLFVQQSRLAALGEMIEQIAHQWRQPLNTLALINQDLYIKYKLGQCDEACFTRSHEQFDEHLQYMSKTIDDFRNYYKSDKTKGAEEIGEIAKAALRLSDVFLNFAKIKTELIVTTHRQVYIAKNEMVQVFLNLIKNAHDVIVERNIVSGKITVTVEESNGSIVIRIQDNGGGISNAVIDKIFDIYFTTKPDSKGTGLGLHMSRYIVEESFGGTISVKNQNNGACFTIVIPVQGETDR